MFPHAIIYQAGKSLNSGSTSLQASLKTRLLYAFMQASGIFVIGFILYGIIATFVPVAKAEMSYVASKMIPNAEATQTLQVSEKLKEPQYNFSLSDNTVKIQQAAKALGVGSHFSVVVPKINAKSNIVANVDAANEKEYSVALKEGVAHAKGTYFPGQGKLIYLFSHSTNSAWNATRYSAIFYLLKKVEKGDSIMVFFADKKYEYKVEQIIVAGPRDTSWLDPNKTTGETLVLQTCTPAGTNFKRLLVIAKPA